MIFLPKSGADKEEKGRDEKIIVPPELPILPLRGTVLYPDLIFRMIRELDGSQRVIVQGVSRIRVKEYIQREPYFRARTDTIEEGFALGVEIEALMMNLKNLFQRAVELAPYLTSELGSVVSNIKSPPILADLIASNL